MASSSSSRGRSYDVFLSFRGTDVRKNFLSHLYGALNQNGLFTYMDDAELRKGEQISSALMKAVEESQVAIIVFSMDYASSWWCLEELVKIMECKVHKDLVVLPVFYKVEPREVREGRESYKRAMDKHETKLGKASEEVKRWKKALFDAGSLSGWELNDGDEAIFVNRIVEEISRQLDRTPLHVAKHPVGTYHRVEKLKSMLSLETRDDVIKIGLWGHGGIGKTTLAKALYNAIFRQFEGSCFLANVSEASRDSKGLISLQEKLLSDILVGGGLAVPSVDAGISLIQYRLCRKKVILILDDVSDREQLNALVGDCEWFAKGSRIIVTTRDRHLLTLLDIDDDHIYQVQTLIYCEALELFNNHAFARNNKIVIRKDLMDGALHYAGGLPLALEVLGSFLRGRREYEWESALSKLARSPTEKINEVLKLSYDGLEHNEKEIFLDIACFFKWQSKEYIMKVLDGCDFHTRIGIHVLVEKSLLSEDRGGGLHMHDLIHMMGMNIVKQECLDDPGKRSRLWLYDDIQYVLLENMGTNAVKAIVLKLPEPKEIYIDSDAFTNMRRLRVLIMINVHAHFQSPICLPNELRWFEWPGCPWIPEFSPGQKKLVGLDLQRTSIQVVTSQPEPVSHIFPHEMLSKMSSLFLQDFKKLKFVNFSECQSLVYTPDLDCLPYLEELDLHGCKNLEHFPNVLQSKNLRLLNLDHCSKVQIFPDIPDKVQGLQMLRLGGTSIEKLPASIENLISLEKMHLKDCRKLDIIPSSIYWLQNLKELILCGCPKLIKFPKKEEDSSDLQMRLGFPNLKKLNLGRCNLSETEFLNDHSCYPVLSELILWGNKFIKLSSCEHLHELDILSVYDCQQLQEIPKIPSKLNYLWANHCLSLSKIPSDIHRVRRTCFEGCEELVRNGLTVNDLIKLEHHYTTSDFMDVILPGGEMPNWLVPNNEGYISLMVSKDFIEKFIRLVFCVVFRAEKGCEFKLKIYTYCNDNYKGGYEVIIDADYDHTWVCSLSLPYEEGDIGPDGWCHLQFIVIASPHVIVKKCGFRMMSKPLEDDLKVLLQHNPLLDPALIHEVGHDDCQTSTMEESPTERENLQDSKTPAEENSSSSIFLQGSNIPDFSLQKLRYTESCPYNHRNVRPGGEMLEEFVPVEEDTICFEASQDLYDDIIGLAFCAVFSVEDGKTEISFDIVPNINSQRRNVLSGTFNSLDSDHIWIQYLNSNVLWGVLEGGVDFDQFDETHLQFSLKVRISGGTLKKLGYMIRWRQPDDALNVKLERYDDSEDFRVGFYGRCVHMAMNKRPSYMEFLCKCHIYHKDTDGEFQKIKSIC